MSERPPSPGSTLAARIVEALMDAGLLDARFEDEAIRVVAEEIKARGADHPGGKDGPHGRTA